MARRRGAAGVGLLTIQPTEIWRFRLARRGLMGYTSEPGALLPAVHS